MLLWNEVPSYWIFLNYCEVQGKQISADALEIGISEQWTTMVASEEPRWQGATIHGPIIEVKQPWAWSILGWVTIQDTVLVAKDVIVTCHVPLWLMSYEHTRGSQSAP